MHGRPRNDTAAGEEGARVGLGDGVALLDEEQRGSPEGRAQRHQRRACRQAGRDHQLSIAVRTDRGERVDLMLEKLVVGSAGEGVGALGGVPAQQPLR